MRRARIIATATVCASLAIATPATGTWSIVAYDDTTGELGVAVASCVGMRAHTTSIAPGRGAASAQALLEPRNLRRVHTLVKSGASADDVVARVTQRSWDDHPERRQYGVVTVGGGERAFTGDGTLRWSGHRTGDGVSVQGNSLTGRPVVDDAFAAASRSGRPLADRLMDGLVAGSRAGGDRRCNVDGVRQTAATAAIDVLRRGDPPYVAISEGPRPWLHLTALDARTRRNAVALLIPRYERWRRGHLDGTWTHPRVPVGSRNADAVAQTASDLTRARTVRLLVIALVGVVVGAVTWRALAAIDGRRRGGADPG